MRAPRWSIAVAAGLSTALDAELGAPQTEQNCSPMLESGRFGVALTLSR